MRFTITPAVGVSTALAFMATPAIAAADTSSSAKERSAGITTAVNQVRAHTDRADFALDRAVLLFGRDNDRSARVAFARSRN